MAVDFSTFDNFVATTNGTTVGAGECWDYVNLVWSHEGGKYWTYPPSDPEATNHGVKWGWLNAEARSANTTSKIIQITSPFQIKRGDIVIISDGTYGHAGFANSAYDGSGYLKQYSQNYGYPTARRSVALDNINMTTFVGAFRYTEWDSTPPTPVTTEKKKKFPWFIYANRNRMRNMI